MTFVADVSTPSAAYRRMDSRWDLIRDLRSGTKGMRALGEKWLQRAQGESPKKYAKRLARSVLFEAFTDTVDTLVSKPFSRDVNLLGADLPDSIAPIERNADRRGNNLTQFSRQLLCDAITHGLSHFLVDLPALAGDENERDLVGRFPYFTHIGAEDLFAPQYATDSSGNLILTQIRFREYVDQAHGEFGSHTVQQIRVIDTPIGGQGMWRKYRQSEDGTWALVDGPTPFTHPNGMPLVTLYTKRVAFMEAVPPFEPVAWLNVQHWNGSSEQDECVRFARIGQLAETGVSPEEAEDGNRIAAASQKLTAEDKDARFYMVESSGSAAQVGETALERIEQRMEFLGKRPLLERVRDPTATGVKANEQSGMTIMQGWLREEERALRLGLDLAAAWTGTEIDESTSVNIFNDFSVASSGPEELAWLLQMANSQKLSVEDLLAEGQRRGALRENTTVDEMLERLQDQTESQLRAMAAVDIGA